MADLVLWERLRNKTDEDLINRAGARAIAKDLYELDILNEVYRIDLNRAKVIKGSADVRGCMDEHSTAAIINYLLESKPIDSAGEWVSPLDLPHGAQFFRGPHAVPVIQLIARFGVSEESFKKACERRGGEVIQFADIAYSFKVFERLPMAVLLWLADDEFPARVSILVDRNAHFQLQLDALLGAMILLEEALLSD